MPYEPLDESAYQDAAIRKDAINDASWGVLSALGMLTPFGVGRGAASAAARAVPAYEPGTTLVPSLGASVSQVASRLPAESRGSYEAIYAKAPEFFDRLLAGQYRAAPGAVGATSTVSAPKLLEISEAQHAAPTLMDLIKQFQLGAPRLPTIAAGAVATPITYRDEIRAALGMENQPRQTSSSLERRRPTFSEILGANMIRADEKRMLPPLSYPPNASERAYGGPVQSDPITQALMIARALSQR